MPQDPVIERQEVLLGANHGDHDQVIVQSHVAPSSTVVEGAAGPDPFKEKDKALAMHIRNFLTTRFPIGYSWFVEADCAQGIAKFNIPLLMGFEFWYVINLRTCGDIGEAVVNGAGEVLERFLLPRDKFDLGRYLEARARSSLLVKPWLDAVPA